MIYLAPMQGYTEAEFRLAWAMFFSGIDVAVSPFIPLSEGIVFRAKHLNDIMPGRNQKLAVVPQVLGNNSEQIIRLARRIADLGYETINWNLGCPKISVAKKQRGSGLLPFPNKIRSILDQVIPNIPVQLSIKTRLGFQSPDEFYELLPVYNDYPLQSLIIHPRIGSQMYEGNLFLEVLDQTINLVKHTIVFSGDISNIRSFEALRKRYPTIEHWMLGRGVLVNPFLPEIILEGSQHLDEATIRHKQYYFAEELYCGLKDKLRNEHTVLNKLKDYWSYFARWFTGEQQVFDTLSRLHSLKEFIHVSNIVLRNNPLASFETRIAKPVGKGIQV